MMPLDLVRDPLRDALKRTEAVLSALSKAPDDERMLSDCEAVIGEALGVFTMVEHAEGVDLCRRLETQLADPDQRAALLLETELDSTLARVRHLRRTLREKALVHEVTGSTEQTAGMSATDFAQAFFASWGSTFPSVALESNSATSLAEERRRYERGLLGLLQTNPESSALTEMAETLQTFARAARSVTARGFWNAAAALLLNWRAAEYSLQPADKKLCAALNIAMRRAATSTEPESTQLTELFQAISQAQPTTESLARAQAMRAALKSAPVMEHEDAELDTEARSKCLEALSVLRDALERLEISETAAAPDALRAAESFSRRCDRAGVAVLRHASQVIAQAVQTYTSTGLGSQSAHALAQTILLIEGALRKQGRLSGGQLARIDAAANSISQADALGAGTSRSVLTRLPIDVLEDATAAACDEARTQLAAIEATLEQFFAAPDAGRRELSAIAPSLEGIRTILLILGAEHSSASVDACREAVAQCAIDGTHDTPEQFARIADCLVELVALLNIVELGQAPGETPYPFSVSAASEPDVALITANHQDAESAACIEALDVADEVDAVGASTIEPAMDPEVALEHASDPELLAIFLEEAKEVLATIGASLALGASVLADKAKATEVRRGYHTLKGSGRMVGLERFAAAAWSVEAALNRYLENGRGVAERLAALVARAHQSLSDWVAQFEAHGGARIDAREIESLASVVEDPIADETTGSADKGASIDGDIGNNAQSKESSQATTARGNSALWAIYQQEAIKHIETLRQELLDLDARESKQVTRALERAAHTLASSSATMGVTAMHELGKAFESFLVAHIRSETPLAPDHSRLVQRVVDMLEEMFNDAVQNFQVRGATELVAALIAIAASTTYRIEHAATEREAQGELAAIEAPSLTKPRTAEAEAKARARRQFRPEDDIDVQLLPLFMEEAEDLVPRIGVALRAWRERADDLVFAQELQRHFHTLKGSARMAGVMGIGELLHSMETRTEQVQRQGLPDAKWFDQIETSFDRLHLLLERVGRAETEPSVLPGESRADANEPHRAESAQEFAVNGVPLLRVRADLLERVTSKFTELSISQARGESLVKSLTSAMRELDEDFEKLRDHLRELEIQAESNLQAQIVLKGGPDRVFDPLELDRYTKLQELTRTMAESLEDFSEMQHQFRHHTNSFGRAYLEQSRLSRDLHREFTRMRLLPFSSIAERLHRIVRQSAKELGKRANLDIHGLGTEIDRIVLERITAPLEHLIRNAVVHGLEAEAERVAANKSVQGEIRIEVRQSHGETLVTLRDDGAGLNWERIRSKAVERGLVPADTPFGSPALSECIFCAGFSTADTLTQLAGRGVGLDVVRSEVKALGGDVRLETQVGAGTAFTLHLPLTLALLRVVIVMAAGRPYALPASMIEHVQSLSSVAFEKACKSRSVEWKDRNYELCYLPQLLGYDDAADVQGRRHTVLLLRSGGDILAVSVDGVVGNREIVTKPLSSQLSRVEGVTGAALLSTGEIALVLNPLAIRGRVGNRPLDATGASEMLPAIAKRSVLVVDDSVTVRKITGKFLAREGFEVHTAKNGLEALEQLANVKPDVMLVDIEMPQMDGFEFTRAVRGTAQHKDIPIIMITSRTAEKHRQHALDLGVNVFLGKPYTEKDLLAHIASQLQHAA